MRNLKETITDFPPSTELHHFGYMGFKEYRMVEMKNLTGDDNYHNFQLIVFNHYMVALEHYRDEQVENRNNWLGFPIIRKKDLRRFSNYYKIRDFEVLNQPKKDNKNWIVEFKAYAFNLQIDGKKSLSFRFSNLEEAKMFRDYFDGLKDKIEFEASF